MKFAIIHNLVSTFQSKELIDCRSLIPIQRRCANFQHTLRNEQLTNNVSILGLNFLKLILQGY